MTYTTPINLHPTIIFQGERVIYQGVIHTMVYSKEIQYADKLLDQKELDSAIASVIQASALISIAKSLEIISDSLVKSVAEKLDKEIMEEPHVTTDEMWSDPTADASKRFMGGK